MPPVPLHSCATHLGVTSLPHTHFNPCTMGSGRWRHRLWPHATVTGGNGACVAPVLLETRSHRDTERTLSGPSSLQ
jgi:hypothetical protein